MPLKAATHIPMARAERAIQTLERAALAVDVESFTRELADVLILPQTGGTDIRDWKAYDEPVASGYAAMTEALEALPCPVQHIRRCPPATEEAPEPTAASPSPRR